LLSFVVISTGNPFQRLSSEPKEDELTAKLDAIDSKKDFTFQSIDGNAELVLPETVNEQQTHSYQLILLGNASCSNFSMFSSE
jgi:hypothetical protein